MLASNKNVTLHAARLNPDAAHYLVRIFASPSGPIEPSTGQPWKPYFSTCVISDFAGVGEIQGALTLPEQSLPPLRDLGRKLDLQFLWWQRWDERLMVKLSPVKLKL